MNYITISMLVIAGVIHILPLMGAFGASQLISLYDVKIEDPNLLILMRHRAVLFTLLGAFLIYAAFEPSIRIVAILGGLVSATTFLWLALTTSDYNANMTKVIYADLIAIACLLVSAATLWLSKVN